MTAFYVCSSFAQVNYQVDLIVFSHPQDKTKSIDSILPLLPLDPKISPLVNTTKKTKQPYQLLSPSQSGLRDQYYLLNHRSRYTVLGQYSWLQNTKQQRMVALPIIDNKGWLIQGTIQVQQNGYYHFNAELQCSPPSHPEQVFTVSQKQRLNGEEIYYLDHAQIGMIVKIHQINGKI